MNNEPARPVRQLAATERFSGCRHLLGELQHLAGRIVSAAHLLLGLDYDGTLTPLVDNPAQATLEPETRAVLQSLAARPNTTVAIISGRRLRELRSLVDLDGLYYAGNHGLEISGPGLDFIEAHAARLQKKLGRLATALAKNLSPVAGAVVENKGLSLSVHYRRVTPSLVEEVHRHLQAAIAVAPDCFYLSAGNQVFEVRPQVDWHKGSALSWIARQIGARNVLTMVLGDDRTDEDAFCAHRAGITVRIGDPVATCAAYHLAGPDQVRQFLHWLAQVGMEDGVS